MSGVQEDSIVSGAAAVAEIHLMWPKAPSRHQAYQVNAQLANICRWIRTNTGAAVTSCWARRAKDVTTDEL